MPDRLDVMLVVGSTTGGIGTHVRTLAERLHTLGHGVTVVAPASTAAVFSWASAGARVVTAPIGMTRPTAIASSLRTLTSSARSVDVVHAHGTRAAALAAAAGVEPLIATWHNTAPTRLRRRVAYPVVERLAARRAAVTLVVSADLAARALRAGADDVRIVAVPAPPLAPPTHAAAEVRQALGVGDRPLVLTVARLEAQKRLDVLVDATAGWSERPDRPVVAVAGTGRLHDKLERRARAAGSPLRLLGRRDDVADLLAAADLCVLPSDWEGYPLVAQEALRAGVPYVGTAVGGVPDLVGDAGVLVPPGDPAALRRAVEGLLGDETAREQLRAAGPRQAAQWPTVSETVNDLLATYRTLMSR